MEPHGYSHLICSFFASADYGVIVLVPCDIVLTCRRKEKPERLLLADISVVQTFCIHASRLYSIRLFHLPVMFPVSLFLFHWENGKRRPKVCARRGKADGLLVWLGFDVTASTPATYQRHRL